MGSKSCKASPEISTFPDKSSRTGKLPILSCYVIIVSESNVSRYFCTKTIDSHLCAPRRLPFIPETAGRGQTWPDIQSLWRPSREVPWSAGTEYGNAVFPPTGLSSTSLSSANSWRPSRSTLRSTRLPPRQAFPASGDRNLQRDTVRIVAHGNATRSRQWGTELAQHDRFQHSRLIGSGQRHRPYLCATDNHESRDLEWLQSAGSVTEYQRSRPRR